MIMAQNNKEKIKQPHLFELLKEDQEPFLLKDYISDRRPRHLKKSLDLPKPSNNHILSQYRRKNPLFQKPSCFSSSHQSPDVTARKSPLFEFPSPISVKKSPGNNNPILLHIPARTAAMLLEAASRIQKKPTGPNKPKTHKFGLFGSLLRRLTSSQQRRVTKSNQVVGERDKSTEEVSECPRPSSSGVWSESCHGDEEEKSSTEGDDEERSCCSSVDFDSKLIALCEDSEDRFCDQSPFRFVLQRSSSLSSSSSGRRTPEFSSPVSSPPRCLGVLEGQEKGFEEEDEEKEQFSPVSVLDPPFEDDYDVHDDDHHDQDHDHDHEEQDSFDMETSFANVQRTKRQLLQKLRRFERLAELDPIELEKRMLEDDDDEEIKYVRASEDYESDALDIKHVDDFVRETLGKSSHHRVPGHMKRLVSDLVSEETRHQNSVSNDIDDIIAKGVVKRFESWKEVRSNTIDMMVEQDLRNELRGIWKNNNNDQIVETAMEIEISIFSLLVEELAQELACFSET